MNQNEKITEGTSLQALLEDKDTIDIEALGGSDVEIDSTINSSGQDADAKINDNTESDVSPAEPEVENVVIEDVEILHSFIAESKDHLENIEEKILKLEDSNDNSLINDIFRSMHTMKGTSAFFGFHNIERLSHSLESVLDDLRNEIMTLSSDTVDLLLAGTDILGKQIAELEHHSSSLGNQPGTIALHTTADSAEITDRIKALRSGESPSAADQPDTEEHSTDDLITPEIIENFVSESADLLDATEELILELEKSPENKDVLDGAFRCIHTLKGNAGFLGLSQFEHISMDLESVLDSVRNDSRSADQRAIEIILSTIDSLRKAISSVNKNAEKENGSGAGLEDEAYKPVGEILVEMGAVSKDEVNSALNQQERKIGEILLEEGKVSDRDLETALSTQHKTQTPSVDGQQGVLERKDIRVDMNKLDKLFDLMGELITAEAMVINNPELESLELESFDRAANYLSKITREMQEITMSVRMIPLEGLFNKMRRLVRDLSRKFSKDINLKVRGQETEMDRNVIEEIADPLMHIIRNAIDHGVEGAESRKAAGKGPSGTISLGAKYEGNEIWIIVKDDGRGLDREKILKKAEERQLLKGESDALTDEDIWQLLFEPGFSTAEKVSEISGRGVGMDVVKRNVEKLRGKIDISTVPGQGTEIILKIPLTLAIIDGITAQVGNILYAVPLGDILEFHKAKPEQITNTDANREVLTLRDKLIPVVKLHEFFETASEKTETGDGILIVTRRNGRQAALLVDEIIGYHQIVVKALPEYMGEMRAISGCSILGNGEVSLIIDTGSLLKENLI